MNIKQLFIGFGVSIFMGNAISAPLSITIEESAGVTGSQAQPAVEKMYVERKNVIEKSFSNLKKKTKAPEEMSMILLAHDSVDCMDRSMAAFPLLVEIIEGEKMNASGIAKVMEDNCVLDVLVHVKRNLPEKLDLAKGVYIKLGFKIPEDDLAGF